MALIKLRCGNCSHRGVLSALVLPGSVVCSKCGKRVVVTAADGKQQVRGRGRYDIKPDATWQRYEASCCSTVEAS